IGIAVYPDDSDDPDELLKHADVAMYRSKDLGRNTYQFLDANLAEHRLKQHTLEAALDRSGAWRGPADGIHSTRRGIGAHPCAGRRGAAHGRDAVRRMAQGRH